MQGRRAWRGGTGYSDRRPLRLRNIGGTPFRRHGVVPYLGHKTHQCLMYRTYHLANLTSKEACGILVSHPLTKRSLTWFCRTGEAIAKARDGHLDCVLPYHRRPSAASRRAFRCLLWETRTPHGRRNPWRPSYGPSASDVPRLPTINTAGTDGWEISHRPRRSLHALPPDRPIVAPARQSCLLRTWVTELRSREGSDGETKGGYLVGRYVAWKARAGNSAPGVASEQEVCHV